MGRGEPPGMRALSHPYTLPGDTIIQANGNGGTLVTPRLESIRHRPCGFPAPAHVAGRTGAGLRLDLPAALLSLVNLAASPGRLACRAPISGYVLSVQTIQSVLAPID